eukprot:TRINITY_DN4664_c0_g5_i3.p1 TRINITY_DN4664_c0_g5~~TRINITY_DN4664_c0_g5_i3.p1  ORF type:complete len:367 (-),score=113.52 TRINITY_DN4664_c0_g5_i3:47-1147(-)
MKILTPEEEIAIKDRNNLIVIGRSGTGKTLCGLLRIIAAESLLNEKDKEYDKFVDAISNDEERQCCFHSVFMTASNILTQEVCKKYVEAMEVFKKLQMRNRKNFKIDKKMIIKESQRKIEEIPSTMNKLEDKHFPLFVTAKQLLMLIDTALENPFFKTTHSKALQNLEKMGRWGLATGVSEGIEQKLVVADEEIEAITNELYNEIRDASDDFDECREEIKEKVKEADELKGIEVQYEQFRILFWNKFYGNKKLPPNISCSAVWKEIYTYIKGSTKSHEFAGRYLPLVGYQKLFKPASILTKEEEKLVYDIFLAYQKWMNENMNYDFLDILNHVLDNIKWGYRGVPMYSALIPVSYTHLTLPTNREV